MLLLVVVSIIVFLIYLELGLYVLFKNPSSKLNRSFFYMCICLVVWALSFVFINKADSFEELNTWVKVGSFGWCLIPALTLKFNSCLVNFPKSDKKKNLLFGVFLMVGICFFLMVLTDQWVIFKASEYNKFGYYVFDRSYIIIYAYLIYLFTFISLMVYMFVKWRHKLSEKNEKKQFEIITISFFISAIWIISVEIVYPFIGNNPHIITTHIASLFYIGGLAYSMIKFRLFAVTPSLIADKVIDELRELLFFTDIKTNIIKTNVYTQKVLSFNFSKAYGKPLKRLFADEDLLENHLNKARAKNHHEPIEINARSSIGDLIPVKLFILHVVDEFGDDLGFVVHGSDNREGKRLEEEIAIRKKTEERLKNKGEILESMVREREKELEKSFKSLQVKIAYRLRIEEQIKTDISEKEILINEIHNRVISNMNMIISLVNTQTPHNLSLKTYHKLQEFNQRVKSMLMVHDNLYLSINYSDVDFARFLNNIIEDLLRFHNKEGKITIKSNISNVFLNIDYAIPLGLIANELISNALMHAFPKSFIQKQESLKPTIFINYTFDNNYYYLIVNDNGKQIPKKLNIENLRTTGMQLVDILVKEQISGDWNINTEMGSFVKVAFSVEK